MTSPSSDVVKCSFCEHTSKDQGRVIYGCEGCGADVCSDCSDNDERDENRILCNPDPSRFPGRRCSPRKRWL